MIHISFPVYVSRIMRFLTLAAPYPETRQCYSSFYYFPMQNTRSSPLYLSTRQCTPSDFIHIANVFPSSYPCQLALTRRYEYSVMYASIRRFVSSVKVGQSMGMRSICCVAACSLSQDNNVRATERRQFCASERVKLLAQMLPFIQRVQKNIIVVKLGGAAMTDASLTGQVIKDLVLLTAMGVRPVLVHGSQAGGFASHEPANGEAIGLIVLAGKVNKSLVAEIHQAGGSATGLCGVDRKLLTARSNENYNHGLIAEISHINSNVLPNIIDKGHIPVIAALAEDRDNRKIYEIDADLVAGEIAASLGAKSLILMSDQTLGLILDSSDRSPKLFSMQQLAKLMEQGLVSKCAVSMANCCIRSLAQGVGSVHIINDCDSHALLLETLTEDRSGILITPS